METQNHQILEDLGNKYLKEKNYTKAKKYFKILSKNYNSDIAQYNLGIIYKQEKKYLKSKKYFELAAEKNNTNALMKLGIIYRDGLGVKKEPTKTFKYFELAAKLGNANALFYLGVFYQDGLGIKQNINRSRRYYKLAAQHNISEAMINLGLYYVNENNIELAKYYWGISNNSKAQYNLGILYQNEKNYKEAKKYYELAAEQNHSEAILAIGKLYLNGFGVEENINIALDYIIKAARLGNNNALQIINEAVEAVEGANEEFEIENIKNKMRCSYKAC